MLSREVELGSEGQGQPIKDQKYGKRLFLVKTECCTAGIMVTPEISVCYTLYLFVITIEIVISF